MFFLIIKNACICRILIFFLLIILLFLKIMLIKDLSLRINDYFYLFFLSLDFRRQNLFSIVLFIFFLFEKTRLIFLIVFSSNKYHFIKRTSFNLSPVWSSDEVNLPKLFSDFKYKFYFMLFFPIKINSLGEWN